MTMITRFLIYSIVIILASVAVTSIVSVNATINAYLDDKSEEMYRICLLLGEDAAIANEAKQSGFYTDDTLDDLAARYNDVTGFRVTFIGADGTVLADSRSGENIIYMENHADREEVIQALAEGRGHARRDSASFRSEYIYESIRQDLPDGSLLVVRLSMEVDKSRIAAEHARPVATLSAIIGIALGIVISLLYMRILTRPIRRMERQLEETLEKNKKAENIRKEFVANVTHELKTPLTSISGFAETLQGNAGEKPEVRARFLEIISLESARLSRLIDDTLIIQDIESGRDVMAPEGDIDVTQSIKEVLETLRHLAESKKTELLLDAQYEMHIGGDEGRFKQLMVNLVENAIKYSPDHKKVFIKAFKDDDGCVTVSVRDEGIGISEEDIPRVFERFYRVDKSRSRDEGGTGLGLAIVKHIATLFDANLGVESEPGVGSTFTIRFPAD